MGRGDCRSDDYMVITSQTERAWMVKGWAFRNHTEETLKAIAAFLKDGDTAHLKNTTYRNVQPRKN